MTLEQTLHKMADTILALDEASMVHLLDKYKKQMENPEISRNWERAVIVFFIINAVRAKNQLLNEQILHLQQKPPESPSPPVKKKPNLRLVQPDDSDMDGRTTI
jgi:hypothetical protein